MANTPLAKLVQAWSKAPDESLRSLILAHDDAAPLASLVGLSSLKLAQVQERLAQFKGGTHPRDPRLTRALEGLLTTVPWSSDGSKTMWRQVFTLVAASKDARFTQLAPDFKVRPLMQTWLREQFARAIAELPKAFPDRDRKWEAELAAMQRIAPPSQEKRASSKNDSQLLAEIFANPADDAPRLVYADSLLERGDARGEFISLQCGDGNPKREKALLKEHAKAWLAPFGPCLNAGVEWRRGFPSRGVVKFKNQQLAEQYGTLPDWATFEELSWSEPGASAANQRPWTLHISKAFRHLRVAERPYLPLMLDVTEPWALERLATELVAPEHLKRLADSTRFPNLHTLEVRGLTNSLWFKGLTKLANVKRLILWTGERLDAWLPIVNALSIEEFWLGPAVRLTRAASGQFTKLNFHVDPGVLTAFRDAQDLLPGYVTEVSFTGEGELNPQVEAMVRSKVRAPGAADPVTTRDPTSLLGVPLGASVAWLDDGVHVVVTSRDRALIVDAKTQRIVREFPIAFGALIHPLGHVPWVCELMGIRAFDANTGASSTLINRSDEGFVRVNASVDGSRISFGRTVLDVKSGQLVPPPRGWKGALRLADDRAAMNWERQPYELLRPGKKPVPLEDGHFLIGMMLVEGAFIARINTGLAKWDVETGKRLTLLPLPDERHHVPPRVSRDGSVVVVPSSGVITLAALPSLERIADVKVPASPQAVDLSPDGRQLAVVAANQLHFLAVPTARR